MDKKLLLLSIVACGAGLTQDFALCETMYERAVDLFHKLFDINTLEYTKAVMLLAHVGFTRGRYEECVCYVSLCNQLFSTLSASMGLTDELRSLYCFIIGAVISTSKDREDRNHLYLKGRRISSQPYDVTFLGAFYTHGEITQTPNPDPEWNLDKVCAILNESEELLQVSYNVTVPDYSSLGCLLLIWAHRASAYWKDGRYDLSLYWSSKATELSFHGRLKYHYTSVIIAMGLITRLHIQSENVYNLEQNLKILSILREYYPFVKYLIQEAREVLAKHRLIETQELEQQQVDGEDSQFYFSNYFEVPAVCQQPTQQQQQPTQAPRPEMSHRDGTIPVGWHGPFTISEI